MVKLIKTVLSIDVCIRCPRDYQTGPVFTTLFNDCYGKCYICEHIPIPPVVEHLIAHKGNEEIKYDWNNLFLACVHCNKVKEKREYDDGILNPTKVDPEDYIEFCLVVDNFKEKVVIRNICETKEMILVEKTIKLLDMIYNNSSARDNQKVSSIQLKNMLSKNVRDFCLLLENYKEERDIGSYNNINDEISRKSEFAAFKRYIIRRDPVLKTEFENTLKDC